MHMQLKIRRLLDFNMLFQLVLAKFFNSELYTCLPKVDHVIESCKEPIVFATFHFLCLKGHKVLSIFVDALTSYHWQGSIQDLSFGAEVPSDRSVRGGSGSCPPPPPEMFWNKYALRCNLVHFETHFEKCFSVCTDLVASGWFFRISSLYTVMIKKQYFF